MRTISRKLVLPFLQDQALGVVGGREPLGCDGLVCKIFRQPGSTNKREGKEVAAPARIEDWLKTVEPHRFWG